MNHLKSAQIRAQTREPFNQRQTTRRTRHAFFSDDFDFDPLGIGIRTWSTYSGYTCI